MNWYKQRRVAMPIYDVYHGTNNTDSIYDQNFSYSYMGKGNDEYGPGFYFTNDLSSAERYMNDGPSPGVIEAQVNISNPIEIDGTDSSTFFEKMPSIDRNQAKNMLLYSLSTLGDEVLNDWGDIEYEGRELVIQRVIDNYADKPLMFAAYDFFKSDTIAAFNYIKSEMGYDGIVVSFNDGIKIIVAWFENQINITSNK